MSISETRPANNEPFTLNSTSEFTIERSLVKEREKIEVSPDALLSDNHSEKSRDLTDRWRSNRDEGNLIVADECGDARQVTPSPESLVLLPSIAAAGPIEPFLKVYNDKSSRGIAEISHFFAPQMVIGENPPGCGGRAGKASHMKNGRNEETDIDKYIAKYVPHSDVVINSIFRAGKIATLTVKPVLAAAQDTATERIYPLAYFRRLPSGAIESRTSVPFSYLVANNYNPEQIYEGGMPHLLDRNDLPDVFIEFMEKNDDQTKELRYKFPDFQNEQLVQNPKTLILSTNIKPIRIRYPHTFSLPGSFFELRFGRDRIEQVDNVNEQSLREALNQAHYPILHSVKHHEQENKDFSKTNRILVETSDIDLSVDLAAELADKPWMEDWMQLPNHKILVAQARGGETTKVEYLT